MVLLYFYNLIVVFRHPTASFKSSVIYLVLSGNGSSGQTAEPVGRGSARGMRVRPTEIVRSAAGSRVVNLLGKVVNLLRKCSLVINNVIILFALPNCKLLYSICRRVAVIEPKIRMFRMGFDHARGIQPCRPV